MGFHIDEAPAGPNKEAADGALDIDAAYERVEGEGYTELALNRLDEYIAAGLDPIKALRAATRNPHETAYQIVRDIYPKCPELPADAKKEFFDWWKEQTLAHAEDNPPAHIEELLENGKTYGFALKDCDRGFQNELAGRIAYNADAKTLEKLINEGVKFCRRDANYGYTPMHYLALNDEYPISKAEAVCSMSALIRGSGYINDRDNRGNTPLMLAVKNVYASELVRVILDYHPDLGIKNNDGKKAIDIAVENKHLLNIMPVLRAYRRPPNLSEETARELFNVLCEFSKNVKSPPPEYFFGKLLATADFGDGVKSAFFEFGRGNPDGDPEIDGDPVVARYEMPAAEVDRLRVECAKNPALPVKVVCLNGVARASVIRDEQGATKSRDTP